MPIFLNKLINQLQSKLVKLKAYLTEKLKTKQGKIVLGVVLATLYLSFKLFADDIAFWWTKGIPEHYIKVGNAYLSDVSTELKGVDLVSNTLTFQGVKPKGWQVEAELEWSSSGRKCTTRSSWAENPVYIPTRYNSTFYGIDLGDRYIITLPQTTNWHINRCDDKLKEVYLTFYNKEAHSPGTRLQFFARDIPINKEKHGYMADEQWFCTKEDNKYTYSEQAPYELNCRIKGGNYKWQIHHDEITDHTINFDIYIDGENWDADD
ncbi:hypothetical protein [Motilimonas sp. KMU-193]|uniref:hypothetical protein n=1 Tax=Motilimonas sp. KMU-193 TaxID=3388668 RepID=UPI00396B3D85